MTVRCGNTKTHMDRGVVHHHDTIAQVRLCHSRGEDGLKSLEEIMADAEYAAEYAAETGQEDPDARYERHLETNPQYAYEVEMDERRAANGGFPFN